VHSANGMFYARKVAHARTKPVEFLFSAHANTRMASDWKEFLRPNYPKIVLALVLILAFVPFLNIRLGISCPLGLASVEQEDCRPILPNSPLSYAILYLQDPHPDAHLQFMDINGLGLMLGILISYDFSCWVVNYFSKKSIAPIKKKK